VTYLIRRLVFWEPNVSPHKVLLFKAIKKLCPHVDLVLVAQASISNDRKAMGWATPLADGYTEIVAPDVATCRKVARECPNDSFHVFSGMRHVECIVEGLRVVREVESKFALMSEPRVNEGIRGALRFLQSLITEGSLRRNATCVFAIGRNGPSWFTSVGYSKNKVFPFAYFIDQLASESIEQTNPRAALRIGYLGRIVRAKGIFTLLDAFAMFTKTEAVLVLAGPVAEEASTIESAAIRCPGTVKFVGPIPMATVASFLSGLDVLVLASITKDDGWGVVVTEALMIGLPVVATTCVGASLVLNDDRLGVAVAPNAPLELAAAIRRVSKPENLSEAARAWRKDWAREHLSAQAGARYFWSVLEHQFSGSARPAPFYE